MPLPSRRGVLGGAAALLAAARFRAVFDLAPAAAAPLPSDPFTLGVASGDPLPDSVVLWTRLAPDPVHGGGMPAGDVPVTWEVATDPAFTNVVAHGTEPAVAALAHSVHVTVGGLAANSWYHYRFSVEGHTSPTGRTRTTPAAGSHVPLRLGAASCQLYRSGYYTAHAHLAQENCDLIIFLGDYIYESGGAKIVRSHNSGECITLEAYRNRYALYKSDLDLQAAHASCPWLVTWDDHEVENNYAGMQPQDPADNPIFAQRRADAYQAWFEHQPVRLDAPTGVDLLIYRRLQWGSLVTIHLADTRQYRSDQACGDGVVEPCDEWDDPNRTLLGDEQETWLVDGLAASKTLWDLFAQQIVFAPMRIGLWYVMDIWDGYPAQRDRVWPALKSTTNPIVLSGDIHFAGVARLHDSLTDATTPQRGTELTVGSISSTFGDANPAVIKSIIEGYKWWDWVNAADRGYAIIDLDEKKMHAELRVVSTITAPTATVRTDFTVDVDAVPIPVAPDPTTTTSTTSTSTTVAPAPAVGAAAATPAPVVVAQPGFTG